MTNQGDQWQRPGDEGDWDTPPPIGQAYPSGQPGGRPEPGRWDAPRPGVIPLRPIGLSEIIDGAISTIRRYPALMLGLTAIIVTISEVVSLIATLPMLSWDLDPFATDPQVIDDAAFASAMGGQAIAGLLTGLAGLLLTGVLTAVVGKAVIGQDTSFSEVWAAVKPSLLRLVALAVLFLLALAAIVVIVVGMFFIHPAAGVLSMLAALFVVVWLGVKLYLAVPALVLERATIMRSLQRSYMLVTGSWWRVFGILIVIGLVVLVLTMILQIPFFLLATFAGAVTESLLLAAVIGSVGAILASLLIYPFGAATVALLYTDLRMRKEGLDIELARRAGPGSGGAPPGAP
ncbi:glycerophosphoryl diester phosphodiesterase membrane domain-containing protein [Hoyosella subflava]|uniref:Putative integral membrane protein n=1 Tax=Hoyosella subflava (strain DSM 45089 / JCM 17490 / NBRC 109087 / DQS3-9A1) TaxID=443218 RepID=F6EHE6_HOYSD|nr:glycerophosphoryl diester phosphodiesterase membrane domain-containing protein [Hoyosella subflava]AEF41125.1 Putative integral membrane protein [Hoyosella subflava DQS3-9A1]